MENKILKVLEFLKENEKEDSNLEIWYITDDDCRNLVTK